MAIKIHPSADVQTADIGDNTRVWQYAIILQNAKIGSNCNICAHTFIENDVFIGDNVTVKCGVYLWNGIHVGNNVFIGPNATFCNDKHPKSGNASFECLETIIEDDVSIGANATILPGVRLNKGCVVAAGAVVVNDVPQGVTVVGVPAKAIGE